MNYPALQSQADDFARLVNEVSTEAAQLLRIPPYGGWDEHREVAAEWLSADGHPIPKDRVLLCAGGHHAVMASMLATGLIGKTMAVDELTYPGFKIQAACLGIDLIACAGDSQGMLPEALEAAAREHGTAAVYLMPTVHNPLGLVMPEDRRRQLCDIAERHDMVIIDDDAYRFTEADPPPTFAALAPHRAFSVWSFTKPYAPVMKLSYLSFPQPYQKALTDAIRITSTGAPALFAAAGSRMIRSGALPNLMSAKRLDAARRQALATEILGGFDLQRHPTSYHLWIDLPPDKPAAALAADLLAHGVKASPSEDFATTQPVKANGLRLALSAPEETDLRRGLEVVRTRLART